MTIGQRPAGLWFSFHIEDEEYVAFIAEDVLRGQFNAAATGQTAMQRAYLANRERIDAVARQKFLLGAARPLRLSADDFAG